MNREELKSAAAQVVSIAEEGQLFTEFVQGGHATPSYAKTHPHYLKLLADSASMEIDNAKAGPEHAAGLDQLKLQMQRLNGAVDKLTNTVNDPSALMKLHDEFVNIARVAGQIGQLL